MFEDVVTLIADRQVPDDYDDLVSVEQSRRDVFVYVRSVGQKEVYEALARGLNPTVVFVLNNRFDYDDEQSIEYNGVLYKVIRTFFKDTDEKLEIVCERALNSEYNLDID